MDMIHLTKNDFSNAISAGKTLVDFWADWCMPCKMLTPVIDEIADEFSDNVKTAKVNVDEEGMLAMEYGIMSIPTVIMFKDGKEIKRFVGVQPKQVYVDALRDGNDSINIEDLEDVNLGEEE